MFWRLKLDIWLQAAIAMAAVVAIHDAIGVSTLRYAALGAVALYLALLAISRRWPVETRAALCVAQVSAILAIYLVEFYLQSGTSSLSRGNEIRRLISGGTQAQPSIAPSVWYFDYFREPIDQGRQPLPLGGISRTLTVFCDEGNGWITYAADHHGFRNPTATGSLQEGAQIAVLGDSFVQGACVPEADTIGGGLRSYGHAVRNLGMAGNGPLLDLAALVEYALPRASHIVWFFYEGNDLKDLSREITSATMMRYLTDGAFQQLAKRQNEIDATLSSGLATLRKTSEWVDFLKLKHLRTAIGLAGIGRSVEEKPSIAPLLPHLRAVLRKAAKASESTKSFTFVYLPSAERYLGVSSYYRAMEREVLRIACEERIKTLSIPSRFDAVSAPLRYYARMQGHYGHLNPRGYALVAEAVHKIIGSDDDDCRLVN